MDFGQWTLATARISLHHPNFFIFAPSRPRPFTNKSVKTTFDSAPLENFVASGCPRSITNPSDLQYACLLLGYFPLFLFGVFRSVLLLVFVIGFSQYLAPVVDIDNGLTFYPGFVL